MDAPPIQYARTEDGVNIAYWTLGEQSNPALLIVPWGIGHLHAEWEIEPYQQWYGRLASKFFLIKYDARGSGLSERHVSEITLDRLAADIGLIASVAGIDRYAILTHALGTLPSIVHAATSSDAVTALVLWTPVVSQAATQATPQARAYKSLTELDWESLRHAAGFNWTGRKQAEVANQLADMMDQAVSSEEWLTIIGQQAEWDVSNRLSQVQAKTLIFGVNDLGYAPLAFAQTATSGIPDARLIVAPDSVGFPQLGEQHETYAAEIEAFILGVPEPSDDAFPQGFRTLLFTDLESSTVLTQSLGDAKAQGVLRGHNDAVRAALEAHGGEEVKHTGDGIFAAFGSAVSAVEAALQIQRELAEAEVRARIGLNAGEPIAEDDDYFGAAVQLAARVCDRAEPGQVLVPQVVRDLCRGKTFTFEDQGEATLKGFPEPARLFVVGRGA